jgi:CRP-like cAMP-binding protein
MQLNEVFRDWEDQVEFPRGAVIFSRGDAADYMYIVLDGEVELSVGQEPLGAEIGGGVFGEMALVEATRSASAVAIRPSRLARISPAQFKDEVRKNPDFAIHLISVVANRLQVAVAMRRL